MRIELDVGDCSLVWDRSWTEILTALCALAWLVMTIMEDKCEAVRDCQSLAKE